MLEKPTLTRFVTVQNREFWLVGAAGLLVLAAYVVNAETVWDDLSLPTGFQALLDRDGYPRAVGILLTGIDLPHEYRTYGLSRLLQFHLWLLSSSAVATSAFIGASQAITGLVLLKLFQKLSFPPHAGLFLALTWVISPWWATWCFHHYSYLILPYQLTFGLCLLVASNPSARISSFACAVFGVLIALSGELHLLAAPMIVFAVALAVAGTRGIRLTAVFSASMALTLLVHRLAWQHWVGATDTPRFKISLLGVALTKERLSAAAGSIASSVIEQLHFLLQFPSGHAWVFGALTSMSYMIATRPSGRSVAPDGRRFTPTWRYFSWIAFICAATIGVYVTVFVLAGLNPGPMPRRYGYVFFTLASAVLGMTGGLVSRLVWNGDRYFLAAWIGLTAAVASHVYVNLIPDSRAHDANLAALLDGRRSMQGEPQAAKGLIVFVASDPSFVDGSVGNSTVGPFVESLAGREFLESPFATYWTTLRAAYHLYGYRFAGAIGAATTTSEIRISGHPHPEDPGAVGTSAVDILANLELDPRRPSYQVTLLKSFDDFAPEFYSRTIDRSPWDARISTPQSSIDLGRTGGDTGDATLGLPDKPFQERRPGQVDPIIANYGLVSGDDGTYTDPNLGSDFGYFKTNRHGAFTYGSIFRDTGMYEVRLDFWELWGRKPGQRKFELSVSWDGVHWSDVAAVDPAAINGDRPFSVVLTRLRANCFYFRLKRLPGSEDAPFIQGIRVRRI